MTHGVPALAGLTCLATRHSVCLTTPAPRRLKPGLRAPLFALYAPQRKPAVSQVSAVYETRWCELLKDSAAADGQDGLGPAGHFTRWKFIPTADDVAAAWSKAAEGFVVVEVKMTI